MCTAWREQSMGWGEGGADGAYLAPLLCPEASSAVYQRLPAPSRSLRRLRADAARASCPVRENTLASCAISQRIWRGLPLILSSLTFTVLFLSVFSPLCHIWDTFEGTSPRFGVAAPSPLLIPVLNAAGLLIINPLLVPESVAWGGNLEEDRLSLLLVRILFVSETRGLPGVDTQSLKPAF